MNFRSPANLTSTSSQSCRTFSAQRKKNRAKSSLPESKLRTGGAYALVRHPLYTGILIMALGWSLMTHSLAGLVFDVMLFVFFDRKAAREEAWLAEKFPDYKAYSKRVKKLVPWVY